MPSPKPMTLPQAAPARPLRRADLPAPVLRRGSPPAQLALPLQRLA